MIFQKIRHLIMRHCVDLGSRLAIDKIDAVIGAALEVHYPDCAHDHTHLVRVLENMFDISQGLAVDRQILVPAILLHDCVPIAKNDRRSKISSTLSAKRADEVLHAVGYGAHARESIVHCIEAHSFSRGIAPRTIEAQVVQDADRLDALGAIGIARLFAVSGSMNRTLYSLWDPFCEVRTPDDAAFSLDHFYRKILTLPDAFHTQCGKKLAKKRLAIVEQFMAALAEELTA